MILRLRSSKPFNNHSTTIQKTFHTIKTTIVTMLYILICLLLGRNCEVAPPPSFQSLLNVHNLHRRVHGASPLHWNSTVAASAAKWANRCTIGKHEPNNTSMGENILYGHVGVGQALVDAPKMWYSEVKTYNYSRPTANHFSQMVWRSTSSIGCAVKQCAGGVTLVVCRYWPPGNYFGKFKENVFPRQSCALSSIASVATGANGAN